MSTTHITVEHVVAPSNRSFDEVVTALEAQLGPKRDLDQLLRDFRSTNPSWQQVRQQLEQMPGSSGLALIDKFDLGVLPTLEGKPTRSIGYMIGNALIAIQMLEHAPEVALYAPFHLVVYEDRAGKTFVAYDRFASQLAQYPHSAIAAVAQQVGQKQEALVARATGG
jgi:uncharacterized protein (DUF302 family)